MLNKKSFDLQPAFMFHASIDRNGERSHELSMQDKALEFEKLRGAQRMGEIGASADAAWNTGAIEARTSTTSCGAFGRVCPGCRTSS